MNHSPDTGGKAPSEGRFSFPASTWKRLAVTGSGWVLVALAEAVAYAVLAVSIRDRGSAVLVLGAALVSLSITVFVSRVGYLTGVRVAGDLFAEIGLALAHARLSWFTVETRALIATAAGRSVPSLMGVPAHQLQVFICTALVPVFVVGATAVVFGGVAGILAVLLALALLGQIWAQRRLQRADSDRNALEKTATRATIELVTHLELLRTAAGPSRAIGRAVDAWSRQKEGMARTNRAAASATFVSVLAGVAPLAGMVVVLAITAGFGDPAAALATIILTSRANAPLDDLALAGIAVNDLRAQTADYRSVVDAPHLARTEEGGSPVGYGIELAGVVRPPKIHGVTASIPEGTRVHVSGPSGSGKSTLLGLLLRFDDPEDGGITLGGVPLSALGEEEIVARIAYVPQDSALFTGTLAENIRLGCPDASDQEVLDAARRAQLGAVIEDSPLGLEQSVGTRGQALSGGERQRVAIARAILKNAPVVIFDEATSALDDQTERRIAEGFADRRTTILVVTHRDPAMWDPDLVIDLQQSAED